MKYFDNILQSNDDNSLLSFLLSLLTHTLVILLFWIGIVHFPDATKPEKMAPEKPLPEVTLPEKMADEEPLPEVTLDLSPLLPEKRAIIQTSSEHPLEQPPDQVDFRSDVNTAAASELPPTGTVPMPTQDGDSDDLLELKDQQNREKDQLTQTSDQTIPLQENPTNGLSATDHPSQTSFNEKEQSSLQNPPLSQDHTIAPATADSHTEALAKVDKPVIGILSSAAKKESYQSDATGSVIRGNISNKGKASVAAEATPIGHYKKMTSNAVRSRWHYYIDDHLDLFNFGTTTISFYITKEGKVTNLRIISNTSNQAFVDCCIKSIMEAKLAIIPPEITATLQDEHLEVEYCFTVYPEAY
ncbi:MAG: energy transducer TonB [Chthoniobacterales bacterium]